MNEKLRYEVTVDGVQESNRELNTMSGSFEDVAKKAAVFATAIIGITKGFSLASESAKLFFQQQASENMVAQALKTTGNAAGVTTEQLKKAADQLQDLSNFGDEQILAEVSNSLLTFKNIAGDTFMRTQQIVVDMAAKFGSLQNSAMQVGFALNDPIEGLTRLRGTGVQFTEDQENLIKSLTETGRIAEAQAIVLSELESQFGGLAQATIDPFAQMENAIGDMKESIGQAFAPMFKNFAMVAKYLKDNEGLMRVFGNSLKVALGIGVGLVVAFTLKLKTLATVLATVKGLAGDWLSLLVGASAGIATTIALTTDFTKAQNGLGDAIDKTNSAMEKSHSLQLQDNAQRELEITQMLKQLTAQEKLYEASLRMFRAKATANMFNFKGDELALKALRKQIQELNDELEMLQKVETARRDNKDISALKEYYDMVKFQDSGYVDWKKQMNEKEGDAFYENLIAQGFLVEDAEEKRRQYIEESNRELLSSHRSWVDKMDKISESYRPQMENESVKFDWSLPEDTFKNNEKMLDDQRDYISEYYNEVREYDSGYYAWKKEQLVSEIEAMQLSDEQKALMLEKRIENITRETEAYQNHEAIINAGINSISGSLVSMIQISTKHMNNWEKMWANVANAIIAEIGRIMAKMVAMFVLQKTLTALNPLGGFFGGLFGGSGGQVIGGASGIPDIVGGYASYTPSLAIDSGTGMQPIYPTTRQKDSESGKISSMLERIERAIVDNSIKGKIRTIDSVELSRAVEEGDNFRGVL